VSYSSTIVDSVAGAATTGGLARAIEHDGRVVELPYGSLFEDSLRIAGALRARGLAPGDRVAIVVPVVSGFIRAVFGFEAAGLVPIPVVPPAQGGDVPTFARQSRDLLTASRAAAVVAANHVAPLLAVDGAAPPLPVLTIEALGDGPALSAPIPVDPAMPALIQFTSGSTAVPKGVVLTHAGLRANLAAIAGPAGLSLTRQDVGVSWLPLYHDMGLIGALLTGMFARVDIVIMSPLLFLKRPTAWLDAISRYRGSISFAPNFAYELCLRRVKPSQIAALDLSSWRVAGCGAEPIRPETLTAFADHFAGAGFRAESFLPSYGLAEHSLAVAFSRRGVRVDAVDAARLVRESRAVPVVDRDGVSTSVRLVGCGRAFPGHELRIVDDDGHPLPERHVGHIVARGPSVMAGYFENSGATAETLRDGWLQTGDLGYLAGGDLFVCGRTKDLIIRHGRKYHPPDLESAIASLPGMRATNVVVFGISNVDEADQVVAVLEARASNAPDGLVDDVRRRIRETAGLELDDVVLTPPGTIPRTTSGKVRRTETRVRFQAGTLLTGGRDGFAAALAAGSDRVA
jgi:fatty-acyl-CoA synthase